MGQWVPLASYEVVEGYVSMVVAERRVLAGEGRSEDEVGAILRDAAETMDVEGICEEFCVMVG